MTANAEKIVPKAFVWRRLHSLLGLWLVLFLFEHLITNSQAALWLGDDGIGFVRMVNLLYSLPYLQAVEIALLGIPILTHGALGIKYIFSAKMNSQKTDGTKPQMKYGRNRAYSWQRYTSWILLFGLIFHVVQMRFLERPEKVARGNQDEYLAPLDLDDGLYTLAARLDVSLYSSNDILALEKETKMVPAFPEDFKSPKPVRFNEEKEKKLIEIQTENEYTNWAHSLSNYKISDTQVVSSSKSPGVATLLSVRNTFKNPFMCILYTVFVLAAVYHAFNGLWTFMISWGAILSFRSQKKMVNFCIGLMLLVLFLGLASIWGSYWINLRT